MKKGWMDNSMAGTGNKGRYELANTLNRFRDNSQLLFTIYQYFFNFLSMDQQLSITINFPTGQLFHKIFQHGTFGKLKAYERKSDLARLTGIDDGDEEMILDLAVKKDMNSFSTISTGRFFKAAFGSSVKNSLPSTNIFLTSFPRSCSESRRLPVGIF